MDITKVQNEPEDPNELEGVDDAIRERVRPANFIRLFCEHY